MPGGVSLCRIAILVRLSLHATSVRQSDYRSERACWKGRRFRCGDGETAFAKQKNKQKRSDRQGRLVDLIRSSRSQSTPMRHFFSRLPEQRT